MSLGAAVIPLATTVAFGTVLALTPPVRALAARMRASDEPGGRRVHQRVTPRMGGAAVYLGFLAGLGTLASSGQWSLSVPLIGYLAGATILVAIGIYDDLRDAPASVRLLLQLVAAHLVFFTGGRLELVRQLTGATLPPDMAGALVYFTTILWIVGVTNAVNFMDGLDFLCSGMMLVNMVSLAAIGLSTSAGELVPVELVLAAAIAAFGLYNCHPASIFLGDTGSTLLGFSAAVLTARQAQLCPPGPRQALLPIVLLAIPIGDTVYAVGRRLWLGVSPASADRGHVHHRLLAMGFGPRAAVRALLTGSMMLGLFALLISLTRGPVTAVVLVGLLGMVAAVVKTMKLLDPDVIREGRSHGPFLLADEEESRTVTSGPIHPGQTPP